MEEPLFLKSADRLRVSGSAFPHNIPHVVVREKAALPSWGFSG
jgi:hypothetical protein